MEKIRQVIKDIVSHGPANEGAFGSEEYHDEMLLNIGGDLDSNQKVTRRILFLLEGDWLFNASGFRQLREDVLKRYIQSTMKDHQLALFLLNDIIRYYRTVCVDFEFKTVERQRTKPWGIRNIKLVFSRKLLYASGLFSVALTADRAWQEKIKILHDLFDLPVIDRMLEVCGKQKMEKVLSSYNCFLDMLADKSIRDHLSALGIERRDDALFRQLKNEGHQFTRQLLTLFENTFDSTHPIRRAVLF